MEENKTEETVFKVPCTKLFGPRPGLKKPVLCPDMKTTKCDDVTTKNEIENIEETTGEKIDQPKKIVKKTSLVPIPYEEPSWGGKPGDKYFLEVRLVLCCFLIFLI
jgi:hypothetical protein